MQFSRIYYYSIKFFYSLSKTVLTITDEMPTQVQQLKYFVFVFLVSSVTAGTVVLRDGMVTMVYSAILLHNKLHYTSWKTLIPLFNGQHISYNTHNIIYFLLYIYHRSICTTYILQLYYIYKSLILKLHIECNKHNTKASFHYTFCY